jgi:hypothetical protein
MRRHGDLYELPLFYTAEGKVKGVTLSNEYDPSVLETTRGFIRFLTRPENARRLADAAGGVAATRSACLTFEVIADEDRQFAEPGFWFPQIPIFFDNPILDDDPQPVRLQTPPEGATHLYVAGLPDYDPYNYDKPFQTIFRHRFFADRVGSVRVTLRAAYAFVAAIDSIGDVVATAESEPGVMWDLELVGDRPIRRLDFYVTDAEIYRICWNPEQ